MTANVIALHPPSQMETRLASFSGDNEWYTPAWYIEMARTVLGSIDIDPASNDHAQKTVKAKVFYTAETNGLDKPWFGRLWMNPPYARKLIQQFVEKAITEFRSGAVTEAVILTNNSGDTAWHQSLAALSSARCITKGRIKFESLTRASNSPAMGQSFFYLGDDSQRFASVFGPVGRIAKNFQYANDNQPLPLAA